MSSISGITGQATYQVLKSMDSKSMLPIFFRDCVDNFRRVSITKQWNKTAGEELFRTEWVTAFVWGWGVNLANKAWDGFFKLSGLKPSAHLGWGEMKSMFGNVKPDSFAGKVLQFGTSEQAKFLHSLTPEQIRQLAPSAEVAHEVAPLLKQMSQGQMGGHLAHYFSKVGFTMMAPSMFIGFGLPALNHFYTNQKLSKTLQTMEAETAKEKEKAASTTPQAAPKPSKDHLPPSSLTFYQPVDSPFAHQPLEAGTFIHPDAAKAQLASFSGLARNTAAVTPTPFATPSQTTSSPLTVTLPSPTLRVNQPQATRFGSSHGNSPLTNALTYAFSERGQTLIGVDAPISLGRVFTSRDPSEAAIWAFREGLFVAMQFFGADLIQNKLTQFFSKRNEGASLTGQRFELLKYLKDQVKTHQAHPDGEGRLQQALKKGWEPFHAMAHNAPNKASWAPHEERQLVESIYHYFAPGNLANRTQAPNVLFDLGKKLGHIPVYHVNGQAMGARLDKAIDTHALFELAQTLGKASQKPLAVLEKELANSYKFKGLALLAANVSSYLVLAEMMPRGQQWISYLIRGNREAPGIPHELQTSPPPLPPQSLGTMVTPPVPPAVSVTSASPSPHATNRPSAILMAQG